MTREEYIRIQNEVYGHTNWIDPSVDMPPECARVLVALRKANWHTVRVIRCTRKEIADPQSPLCFKAKQDNEVVIGWLPLPITPFNEKSHVDEE